MKPSAEEAAEHLDDLCHVPTRDALFARDVQQLSTAAAATTRSSRRKTTYPHTHMPTPHSWIPHMMSQTRQTG